MGLYDIFDDIASRQVTKSETGDSRMFGVVVGVVAKNYDENMPGRICVQIPTRDSEANELKWARIASLSMGKNWGHYFIPEIGDEVLLVFEQGNIEKPFVIGCVPKDGDSVVKKSHDEKNTYKKIVTRHGNTIEFLDGEDEDGKKDKVTVTTAPTGDKAAHQLILDNENHTITLNHQNGKNGVVIDTEAGTMDVKLEHKVTISVGDNVKVILNADSGTVSVKCDKYKLEASGNAAFEASGKLDVSGATVKLEASSMMNVTSNGMNSIGGQPVKIG